MQTFYAAVKDDGIRTSHAEVAEDNERVGFGWEPLGRLVGLLTVDDHTAATVDAALDADGVYVMDGVGVCSTLVIEAP